MKELSQTRNSRNRRDSLGSPPVDVAPSPAIASVDSPAPSDVWVPAHHKRKPYVFFFE